MEGASNLFKDTNSNSELVADSNLQLNESIPESSTVPELKLTQAEEKPDNEEDFTFDPNESEYFQPLEDTLSDKNSENGTHYSDALEPLSDNLIIDDTLIPTSQKAQTQHIKFLHLQLDHLRKELDLQQKNYTNQLELSYRDLARVRADANFSTRNRELITNRYKALEADYIEMQEELENLKHSHNLENTEKLKLKLKDYKLSLHNCKEQMQEYLVTNRDNELLLNRMTTELEELQTKYNDLMGKYIEATTEINDQSSKKRKLNTEESEDSKLTEAAQFMSHFKSLVDDNLELKSELQLAKAQINNLVQTSIQPSELESIKSKAQSLEEDYSALKIDYNTLKQENLALSSNNDTQLKLTKLESELAQERSEHAKTKSEILKLKEDFNQRTQLLQSQLIESSNATAQLQSLLDSQKLLQTQKSTELTLVKEFITKLDAEMNKQLSEAKALYGGKGSKVTVQVLEDLIRLMGTLNKSGESKVKEE